MTFLERHRPPVRAARFSYLGEGLVVTAQKACRVAGYPETNGVGNGSEFPSRDMDLWTYQRGATLDFSRPAKPTGNEFQLDKPDPLVSNFDTGNPIFNTSKCWRQLNPCQRARKRALWQDQGIDYQNAFSRPACCA